MARLVEVMPMRFLPSTVRMSRRCTSFSAQKSIISEKRRTDFVADHSEGKTGKEAWESIRIVLPHSYGKVSA